jgi:hypothetical protein
VSIFQEKAAQGWQLASEISGTLDRIESRIAEAVEQVAAQNSREQFARRQLVGIADATGIADLTLDVPVGLGFRLVSAACSGAAPGGGTGAAIYLGDPSNEANLIHVFTYAQRFSEMFAEGEYVDSGGRIVVRFVGQPLNQRCTANLKLIIMNPTEPLRVR